MRKNYFSTLVLSLVVLLVSAQNQPENNFYLSLRSGEYVMNRVNEKFDFSSWPSVNGNRFGVVKVENNLSLTEQEAFKILGIEFLESFRNGIYVISILPETSVAAINDLNVLASLPWSAEMKWLNSKEEIPSRAKTSSNRVIVNLHPFSNLNLELLLSSVSNLEIEVLEARQTYGFITVACSVESLPDLAEINAIQYIDWKYDFGAPENYTGRTDHRINYLSNENTNGIGYEGQGVNVMLQDDGTLGPHIDRHGREIQFLSVNEGDHGDHVSGTIMGAGNINPLGKGMAPQADLYVYKAAPEYQGFDSISAHYNSYGIVITSTSYSNGCNAGYTALTRTMDDQIEQMPMLMHVFSAGNSGTTNCGYGAGSNWGNITGGHKMGKNVITVANLTENDVIASSSSRGPAHDGRIKPDISAKGTNVFSTIEDYDYGLKTGTSMSCPGVSGSLAVLYSAYEGINGTQPNSGLMKAIVLNTADDIGNPGPDFIHGWGRINARKAYEAIENSMYLSNSVGDGDSVLIPISVPGNLNSAKIMVYWVDPKASIGASTALINDLDMSVSSPSNALLLPLVLDPTPNAATLSSPAAPGADHINNVEQVVINQPSAGTYTLKVKGFDVSQGPQTFYVVYWFEEQKLTLTYPVGGESFVPFTTEKLRWDISPDTGSVFIEYSADNGLTWNSINTASAAQKYYDWSVPNLTSGEVKIRLTANNQSVESAKLSAIRTPTGLSVQYVCPDSIGLTWSSASSATSYYVYRLGDKYMDSIGVSSTTLFVDYGQNPYSDFLWYSVSSNGPQGAEGKRAIAYKVTPGLYNCVVPIDAEVVAVSPDNGSLSACHGDSIFVSFTLSNIGSTPLNSVSATATLNGQSISETFSLNLTPGNDQALSFSQKMLLPTSNSALMVSVNASGDGNPFNDSMTVYINPISSNLVDEVIWKEDFETFSLCNTTADCGVEVCALDNDWTNEDNGLVDDVDWRTNAGDTPSDFTGPTTDHTTNTITGKYVYLEASGSCDEALATLLSPCIKLAQGGKPRLEFWFHMRGADMGSLHVDVYDGIAWHLDVASELTGQQGVQWYPQIIDLSSFAGKKVNIRFRGITGVGYRSDMALDDISVIQPPVANFTVTPQPFNNTVDLVDLSVKADSMVFKLGDGTFMQNVPSSYTYNQASNYTLIQEVFNAAGGDTMEVSISNLSVDDFNSNAQVNQYPNPANNQIVFEFKHTEFESIKIMNSVGEIVRSRSLIGLKSIQLDISDLASGIYFAKFDGNRSAQIQFIKID